MKIAVITANVGGFDIPKLIPNQTVKYDFFSYKDFDIEGDNRHKAKFPKMQSHRLIQYHDIHIWIDSSVQVKSENFVKYMVEQLADNDIAIGKHNFRQCAYEEIDFICAEIIKGNEYLKRRYDFDTLIEVKRYLKTLNFEHNKGLWACGIFARKNNNKVNNMFDCWWISHQQWQTNDQMMFAYLVNEFELKINTIDWKSLFNNEYFKLVNHNE